MLKRLPLWLSVCRMRDSSRVYLAWTAFIGIAATALWLMLPTGAQGSLAVWGQVLAISVASIAFAVLVRFSVTRHLLALGAVASVGVLAGFAGLLVTVGSRAQIFVFPGMAMQLIYLLLSGTAVACGVLSLRARGGAETRPD